MLTTAALPASHTTRAARTACAVPSTAATSSALLAATNATPTHTAATSTTPIGAPALGPAFAHTAAKIATSPALITPTGLSVTAGAAAITSITISGLPIAVTCAHATFSITTPAEITEITPYAAADVTPDITTAVVTTAVVTCAALTFVAAPATAQRDNRTNRGYAGGCRGIMCAFFPCSGMCAPLPKSAMSRP